MGPKRGRAKAQPKSGRATTRSPAQEADPQNKNLDEEESSESISFEFFFEFESVNRSEFVIVPARYVIDGVCDAKKLLMSIG